MTGSAVPFRSDKCAFLVTAAHVCFDHHKQPKPLFTWTDDEPLALNEFRIAWDYRPGYTPDADVALLALSDEIATKLQCSYWFSDVTTVSTTKPKTPGVHYLIAGYPFVRNRITSTDLAPPALATHLITGQIGSIQEVKGKDKTDECHFTLAFPMAKLNTLKGDSFRVPKAQGMSGGGIWRLDIDTTTHMATTP